MQARNATGRPRLQLGNNGGEIGSLGHRARHAGFVGLGDLSGD
jgi:hypothetical protein